MSPKTIVKKYGYSIATFYSLMRDFKVGKLFFLKAESSGPKERRMPEQLRQLVLTYRKKIYQQKIFKYD